MLAQAPTSVFKHVLDPGTDREHEFGLFPLDTAVIRLDEEADLCTVNGAWGTGQSGKGKDRKEKTDQAGAAVSTCGQGLELRSGSQKERLEESIR